MKFYGVSTTHEGWWASKTEGRVSIYRIDKPYLIKRQIDTVVNDDNGVNYDLGRARAVAETTFVEHTSVAVTITFWNVTAATFIYVTGAVADATYVQLANAEVNIVAYAVDVLVCFTESATITDGVFLISKAITIVDWYSCPSANPAFI